MRTPIVLMLLTVGCAHSKADEMPVDAHLAEARVHQANAAEEKGKYAPGSDLRAPGRSPFGEEGRPLTVYNPTEVHLENADRELREAARHIAAARRLESFEDAACKQVPAAERAACPLLASWVKQVKETQSGVQLVMKASVDAAETTKRLNCHLAWAYASGFDRPSCPLFVKGMSIRQADSGAIDLVATEPTVVLKIKEEARKIFRGPADSKPVPVSTR